MLEKVKLTFLNLSSSDLNRAKQYLQRSKLPLKQLMQQLRNTWLTRLVLDAVLGDAL